MELEMKTLKMFASLCKIAKGANSKLMKKKAEGLTKEWNFIAQSEESENESNMTYKSFAMVNEKAKQVLIVNAGSYATNDIGSIFEASINKATPQSFLNDGIVFLDSLIKDYKDYSFISTGHSLGALYAQLSQAYLESKGVDASSYVFELTGAADIVKNFIEEQDLNIPLETIAAYSSVYNVEGSFVNSQLNNQLGCVYTLPKEKVLGVASLLGKIAGIKDADNIFEKVDSALGSFKVNELEQIIPKLNDKTKPTFVKCYDGATYEEENKGENLVGEAINDLAELFDF